MDRSAFDDLVAAMDAAMVVVTVADLDGEVDGCLVGFHSQCSIEPPRYAVWLSVANRTQELAQRATHLAVHVLGTADHELAAHFGGHTGDEVDKLAGVAWSPGSGGVPLLDALPARFVGRIIESIAGPRADHTLYVLEPVAADGPPPEAPLRLAQVTDIDPGHEAEERR